MDGHDDRHWEQSGKEGKIVSFGQLAPVPDNRDKIENYDESSLSAL